MPSTVSPAARRSAAALSASNRRRSLSVGPARPSGSASTAAAASRWPPIARDSTAAARLATSTLAAPPGLSVAESWATTSAGSSTTSSRLWHRIRSAQPGGTSSASRSPSPWTAVIRSATPASTARRVSAARASGLASTTVTRCPASASGTANPPVPPPTSMTIRLPRRSISARSAAHTTAVRGVTGLAWVRSTPASLVGGRRRPRPGGVWTEERSDEGRRRLRRPGPVRAERAPTSRLDAVQGNVVPAEHRVEAGELLVQPVEFVHEDAEVDAVRPAVDLVGLLVEELPFRVPQGHRPLVLARPDRRPLVRPDVNDLLVVLAYPQP